MRIRTNIVIDDELVSEVKALTSLKTRQAVVDLALQELLKRLRRGKLLDLRRKGLWMGNLYRSRRTRSFQT